MELVLFTEKLMGYLEQCKRHKIKPMICVITNNNKKHFLPFDNVQIIPIGNIHIYFLNKNNRMFDIVLTDIVNCEYLEFGLFFSIHLK